MAVFAYIYHQSFVVPQSVSVEMILDQVLSLHFYNNYFPYYSNKHAKIKEVNVIRGSDNDEPFIGGATSNIHEARTNLEGQACGIDIDPAVVIISHPHNNLCAV